jgi:ParB family chromosome partitioning protein
MAKKTGLGRGLDALFSDTIKEPEIEEVTGEIVQNIKITKIEPDKEQPRKRFDEEKLDELANSIKQYGVIQPIIVTLKDDYYQIIAGERRWRAAKKAGLTEIPCLVRTKTEQENREIALIENIQREDLSPLEEAKAYQALIKEYGYSQTELADIVGKKQSTIANKLRLLKLSDDVQFSLNQKQITERHARAMLSLNEEKQQEVLREVLKKKLTVADTERLIKKEPKPKKKKASADVKKTISRNVKIALNTLQQAIGMIEKTGTSLQQETEDLEDEYVITIRIHK